MPWLISCPSNPWTDVMRPCRLPGAPASTSLSAWRVWAPRRGLWAASRPIFSDASSRATRLRPRLTFATRRKASIRRRLRSSATWRVSRNMLSMTRRRRPETGPIGVAPSPSKRSKQFMSDRRRWPTTRGHPGAAMIEDAGGSSHQSPSIRIAGPNLVRHKARYVDRMDAFAAAAHIVRMSDVDFEFLYGGGDYAGKGEVAYRGGHKPCRRYARDRGSPGVAAEAGQVRSTLPR